MELETRRFGVRDAGRSAIAIFIGAVIFVATYFALPVVQKLFLPSVNGGTSGPWLVRPEFAVHMCACAFAAATLLPLALRPLRKRWRAADEADGTQFNPFHNQPETKFRLYVKGYLLLAVYAAAMAFYLLTWEIVGPDGIQLRAPWGIRTYEYGKVISLETIPAGCHSNSRNTSGPHYQVTLESGRFFTYSLENEGMTESTLDAIATYIHDRVGLKWVVRADAEKHD